MISAVKSIKTCQNLGGAASDLRAAAGQRNGLVTRLRQLADRTSSPTTPGSTDALTKAWQASAAADNHYAAWADQVGGKKGCHKGRARRTRRGRAGNRASGRRPPRRSRPAGIWNPIAQKYGLTRARSPSQL